jgi:hypothetical protein
VAPRGDEDQVGAELLSAIAEVERSVPADTIAALAPD